MPSVFGSCINLVRLFLISGRLSHPTKCALCNETLQSYDLEPQRFQISLAGGCLYPGLFPSGFVSYH